MDGETVALLLMLGLIAVSCLALAMRLTITRRTLRREGIEVRSTVERVDPTSDAEVPLLVSFITPGDTYHLRFETEEGETVRKRFQAQVGESVVDLLYDPQNPKRAWPPEKIFGRAATLQIAFLWVLGTICVLLFMAGLANA